MAREWQAILGLAVALGIGCGGWGGGREVARVFMPGPLGRAPGGAPPAPSPRAFLTRAMYSVDQAWARSNGLTPGLAFSHNLRTVFPPTLYAKHPEFFPLEEGKRLDPPEKSYFWQPDLGREDVAAYAAQAAEKYFDAHPTASSFSLGVNDGLMFGESAETLKVLGIRIGPSATSGHFSPGGLKWFRGRPDYSRLVFTFMNRAADDLARTHPDKLLGCLAYYWCENAPDFPVWPQVVPYLTADRAQGYDAAFEREEALLQRRWAVVKAEGGARKAEGSDQGTKGPKDQGPRDQGTRDKRQTTEAEQNKLKAESRELKADDAGRLGLYDYLYGGGFLIPRIHTRLLAENLRWARRAGFTDYYAEVHPNWGLDGPMPWLAAQLLQDPEQSPEALLDEYYRRNFGAAAVPMQRFFERCERQWMTQAGPAFWLKYFRDEAQAALFPAPVCRELRGLLDEAQARATDGVARERVRLVGDAFGLTERLVAMQAAREELQRRALEADRDWRGIAAALARFMAARTDFERYGRDLREREPLAVAEFEWDDYLRDDPVPGALLAMARIAHGGGAEADAARVVKKLKPPEAGRIWRAVTARGMGDELLVAGSLAGPLQPARRVAELDYGVALPAPWQSRVEPWEMFSAQRLDGKTPALRLSGNKNTQVYQWCAAEPGAVHVARVEVRGRVSPGGIVSLVLGWLDRDNRWLGTHIVRLPTGEWPGWAGLEYAEPAPDGALWVGIGLRVENQQPGDWLEARGFSLRARP